MDSAPIGVFLVTLEGLEAGASEGPLTVLAFVKAETAEAAEAAAAAELSAFEWTGVRALRSGEVVDAQALPDDFRAAFDTALRHGCGLIVYDEA